VYTNVAPVISIACLCTAALYIYQLAIGQFGHGIYYYKQLNLRKCHCSSINSVVLLYFSYP